MLIDGQSVVESWLVGGFVQKSKMMKGGTWGVDRSEMRDIDI